jgi:hypothetical protein
MEGLINIYSSVYLTGLNILANKILFFDLVTNIFGSIKFQVVLGLHGSLDYLV